ncbi:MAG: threonine/serine dehydratase [Rhodothermia bacterium]
MLIPADRIEAAYHQIDRIFKASPHFVSDALSEMMGATILCKDETRNPIGSFKGRGASWWMSRHPEIRKVVCASAGNFGQGIAYAGRSAGCEVQIVAATTANPAKVAAMRDLGATVHLEGSDFDAAKDAARMLAKSVDGYFLEDGADVEIAEGAGTIGIELSRYKRGIDAVLVPVGNGALANGIGSYLKAARPDVRLIGVCAEQAPSMAMSWKSGRVVSTETADTIADGIAVRNPVPEALRILAGAIDEMVVVSESDIKGAMQLLYRLEGIITEPAGAVSLAAISKVAKRMPGKTLAMLICGSNIDPTMKHRWLG